MGEFFHGWRRKAGLVTLAMACVLTVGWMRSYVTFDAVLCPDRRLQYSVLSLRGHVTLERDGPILVADRLSGVKWISEAVTARNPQEPWSLLDFEWRRKWGGFDLGAGTNTATNIKWVFATIPYWSLVLPLTLLSAWLLLIKPRPATTAKEHSRE